LRDAAGGDALGGDLPGHRAGRQHHLPHRGRRRGAGQPWRGLRPVQRRDRPRQPRLARAGGRGRRSVRAHQHLPRPAAVRPGPVLRDHLRPRLRDGAAWCMMTGTGAATVSQKGALMAERVWDRFLTEQDKAHVAASVRNPVGFGNNPAVLMIDNYRWVIGDEPEPILEQIKKWPGGTGLAGWQALERIKELLAVARELRIPVCHVTGLDDEASGVPGWSVRRDGGRRAERKGEARSAEAQDRYRRRYDIVEQAAPVPGEVVLYKSS